MEKRLDFREQLLYFCVTVIALHNEAQPRRKASGKKTKQITNMAHSDITCAEAAPCTCGAAAISDQWTVQTAAYLERTLEVLTGERGWKMNFFQKLDENLWHAQMKLSEGSTSEGSTAGSVLACFSIMLNAGEILELKKLY